MKVSGYSCLVLFAAAAVAVGIVLESWLTFLAVVFFAFLFLGMRFGFWTPSGIFLSALCMLLAGYALFGSGFAYLGIPPIFVGELVLVLGIFMTLSKGGISLAMRSHLSWLLLGFAIWGAFCTLPYVTTYGVDSLRDAALWGYGAFAIFSAGALLKSRRLVRVPQYFRRFLPVLLLWTPISLFLAFYFSDSLPFVPGAEITILETRPYFAAAHLAGVASFLAIGIIGARRPGIPPPNPVVSEWVLWCLWIVGFFLSASQRRTSILAFLAAFLLTVVLFPTRRWWKAAALAYVLLASFVIFQPKIRFELERKVDPGQVVKNVSSIFGSTNDGLETTKEWRFIWWRQIVRDTLFGDHFWRGRGYGINLAEYSGLDLAPDDKTRSPHNAHLTILARSGVIGLGLWAILQAAFGVGLARCALRAKRIGDVWWAGLFVWILAYWGAFLTTMSAEVFLENPHGGIWFWTIFGTGIAAKETYRKQGRETLQGRITTLDGGRS